MVIVHFFAAESQERRNDPNINFNTWNESKESWFLCDGGWNYELGKKISRINLLMDPNEDVWLWSFDTHYEFTVKSAYKFLQSLNSKPGEKWFILACSLYLSTYISPCYMMTQLCPFFPWQDSPHFFILVFLGNNLHVLSQSFLFLFLLSCFTGEKWFQMMESVDHKSKIGNRMII